MLSEHVSRHEGTEARRHEVGGRHGGDAVGGEEYLKPPVGWRPPAAQSRREHMIEVATFFLLGGATATAVLLAAWGVAVSG